MFDKRPDFEITGSSSEFNDFMPSKQRPLRLQFERLESRRLLAFTVNPSGFEQEMLELINRLRADPQAELGRLINLPATNPATSQDPDVNLALGARLNCSTGQPDPNGACGGVGVSGSTLAAQFAALEAAPPLAWHDALFNAARDYGQTMIDAQQQSHRLPPVPDSRQRILDADGDWPESLVSPTNFESAENIFGAAQSVFHGHAAFAIDWGRTANGIQSPAGHRNNIMSPTKREVGVGIIRQSVADNVGIPDVTGPFVVVQEFATRNPPGGFGDPYLLGVAHIDHNNNGHYNAGEGVGGVTVIVRGIDGTATPSNNVATTKSAGGYQFQVPPGRYQVTFSNPSFPNDFVASDITVVANTNKKVDLSDAETVVLPFIEFTVANQTVSESVGQVSLTARISPAATSEFRVPLAIGGTAVEGIAADFTISSRELIVPAGATEASVTVQVLDDLLSDPDETVEVMLGESTVALLGSLRNHTIAIVDDDPLPLVEFIDASLTVIEDVGAVTVTAHLSMISERDITVPLLVTGTATGNGSDYLGTAANMRFAAGSTTASLSLTVVDESSSETNETVVLALGEPDYAQRGTNGKFTLVITDNDEVGEWRNPNNHLDVTGDGLVTSRDVLVAINELNRQTFIDPLGQLPDRSGFSDALFYDASGDGRLVPGDILAIINFLNQPGTGESPARLPQRGSEGPTEKNADAPAHSTQRSKGAKECAQIESPALRCKPLKLVYLSSISSALHRHNRQRGLNHDETWLIDTT